MIKIGFITDMSGLYADIDGPAGAEAIKMAIADIGGTVDGKKIELLVADHQNKPDVAAAKAREWFDTQGLDMLIGGTNSGTAWRWPRSRRRRRSPSSRSAPATSALTNEQCTPYTVHYAYDTDGAGQGHRQRGRQGGRQELVLPDRRLRLRHAAADRHHRRSSRRRAARSSARCAHPLSASDFSSFLLQAQSSKAQILGLANAGGDTINSIKAANEFGITKTMKLAGLLMFINDVHSLGLKTTQGMYLTDSWYWNRDAESRAWSRKFFEKIKRMPSSLQAADYSATLHYLKAVKATGSDDADKVMAQMKKTKINDIYAKGGYIRDDGRMVHDMYLMQVKTPDESTEPWDYYKVAETFKGEEAWTTKAESKCALWK